MLDKETHWYVQSQGTGVMKTYESTRHLGNCVFQFRSGGGGSKNSSGHTAQDSEWERGIWGL